MAKYRKVSTVIWNDAKFVSLSDDGKLLFLFILTHPHMTSLGAMRATPAGLAAELGWLPERLSEAFDEALSRGLVKADIQASCVYLPRFIKHNPPESANVVKAWAKALELIPECGLKQQAIQGVNDYVAASSKAFRKALGKMPEAFAKSCPNQEQEQEQDINTLSTREDGHHQVRDARPRYPMSDAWEPVYETLSGKLRQMGVPPDQANQLLADQSLLGEFRSYWLERPEILRTDGEWAHALASSINRVRKQMVKPDETCQRDNRGRSARVSDKLDQIIRDSVAASG